MFALRSVIECPVCAGEHDALGPRLGSLRLIACDQLTPAGTPRFFPHPEVNLLVLGAGIGVNVAPPRELTVAEQQSLLAKQQQEIDKLEADKRIAALQAETSQKLAALKKEKA